MSSIFTGEANDLLDRATRPQSLITTIYGTYSRPIGGWLSVSSLVQLCEQLDVEEGAVRSALSRFKRRGILVAGKQDGVTGYALSPEARRTFDLGDSRVLERREPPRDEGWVLVAFSVPERTRALRYQLRSRLVRVGFAQVAGGLWIAPRQLGDDAVSLAKSLGVEKYMSLFTAQHLAFLPTPAAVAQWWDLEGLQEMYTSFSKTVKPISKYWTAKKDAQPDPLRAFVDYTKILTAWRHVPYFDPGLPREYLPKNWTGFQVIDSFFKIHDQLAAPALFHVIRTTK